MTEAGVANSSAKVFPAGSLAIAMYGATIGRLGILGGPAATNQACAVLLAEGETRELLRYVFYYLWSAREDLKNHGKGGAQPNISQGLLKSYSIRLSPSGERMRIVLEVESYLSRLDAAVGGLKRVQANLKRYRASVLKAAVEGRLVPTEAELARAEGRTYEPASELLARILKERRARWEAAELASMKAKGKRPKDDKWKSNYREPIPADTKDLPELPEGWCWASLEALTSAVRVICYGILMPKAHVPGGVPYVKVRDMRLGVLDVEALQRTAPEISAKYPRSVLQAGDLLIAIRGTYGRVVDVPAELSGGNITQDSARLDLSPELVTRYVKAFLLSPLADTYFKRVARGVAVKGVNIADLRLAPIALPPSTEQQRIAEMVEDQVSVIDATAAITRASLTRCTRLRQAILKWAFEGKLVDQDPNDEPASALLERIRAEREAVVAAGTRTKRSASRKTNGTPSTRQRKRAAGA